MVTGTIHFYLGAIRIAQLMQKRGLKQRWTQHSYNRPTCNDGACERFLRCETAASKHTGKFLRGFDHFFHTPISGSCAAQGIRTPMPTYVMHPCVAERDGFVLHDFNEATGVVIVRMGAEHCPQVCVIPATQEIRHEFSIGARTTINENAVWEGIVPLGNSNAVRVSQRENINFDSVEHIYQFFPHGKPSSKPQMDGTANPHFQALCKGCNVGVGKWGWPEAITPHVTRKREGL